MENLWKIMDLWEIYGKSMENHGFMGNLWKIYGKYGKIVNKPLKTIVKP